MSRFLWMHNGGISHFGLIKKSILGFLSLEMINNIGGTTDTEYVGALFMELLPRKHQHANTCYSHLMDDYTIDELADTMNKTITTLIEIQIEAVRALGQELEPSSLNFCVTDGRSMVATRFRY